MAVNRNGPGDRVLSLCQRATSELVLVAPFIKEGVLKRLLDNTAAQVGVRCVTRWRPEEILAGVSDLGVWGLIADRPGAELFLQPSLHAKYYRTGSECLIGSANLTAAALGWKVDPNIEALVSVANDHPDLLGLEDQIFASAVSVNEGLVAAIEAAVAALRDEGVLGVIPETEFDPETSETLQPTLDRRRWIPRLRYPELLFTAYSGRQGELATGSRESALADLHVLNPPPGLRESGFNSCIAAALLQLPVISYLDHFVVAPQRFGAVRDMLAARLASGPEEFDPSEAWQTLMRWLLHFMPNRYAVSVPNYSEVFFRLDVPGGENPA